MSRIKNQSPALVVAAVALVAALAGTAVGGVAVTALNKKEKKQVNRIANKQGKKQAKKQIKRRAPTLDVRSAELAGTAAAANTAARADTATEANGVRPHAIRFDAPASTPARTLLNRGGLRVVAECDQFGRAIVNLVSIGNNGSWFISRENGNGELVFDDNVVGAGESVSAITESGAGATSLRLTVRWLGAGGTSLTGDLQAYQDTGVAQCRVAGALLET
jgi:hypothetical protein